MHYRIYLSLGGSVCGFLLFHPYTMIVYHLMGLDHDQGGLARHIGELFTLTLRTFTPEMIPMAMAFAVLGGIIGYLSGVVLDKKKKMIELEHENEKKKIALDTLQKLMLTLSHYLLNANTVIGGMAARCIKKEEDSDLTTYLDVIRKESIKIDAVIAALRKITHIKTEGAYSTEDNMLIDIGDQLARELKDDSAKAD